MFKVADSDSDTSDGYLTDNGIDESFGHQPSPKRRRRCDVSTPEEEQEEREASETLRDFQEGLHEIYNGQDVVLDEAYAEYITTGDTEYVPDDSESDDSADEDDSEEESGDEEGCEDDESSGSEYGEGEDLESEGEYMESEGEYMESEDLGSEGDAGREDDAGPHEDEGHEDAGHEEYGHKSESEE